MDGANAPREQAQVDQAEQVFEVVHATGMAPMPLPLIWRWINAVALILMAFVQFPKVLGMQLPGVVVWLFGIGGFLLLLSLWQQLALSAPCSLLLNEGGLRLKYRWRWFDACTGWQVPMSHLQAHALRLQAEPMLHGQDPLRGLQLLMPGHRVLVRRLFPAAWRLKGGGRPWNGRIGSSRPSWCSAIA